MAVNNSTNDKAERWYFTKEQLENTPSRKSGYDSFKELSYRQQAANFIQDMGQRLKVSQLCINTAIVYMHRFYVFHSFTHFPWHQMAAAALFLAAKVEEQPRKLEYVIRIANICRNPKDTSIDVNSERYLAQSQDLVFNENVLLQTLGFDVAIDHPHTHVVRCCHLVRASKDLAQTSYFMASNSLHLTTMCLQYKPTVVACFCIHVACKWSNWEIPLSNEDKEWFSYVDPTVTAELLQQLTKEFLVIFESCPSRLKEKIMAIADNTLSHSVAPINSPFDTDPRKITPPDQKDSHSHRSQHEGKIESDPHKHRSSRPHDSSSSSQQQREREYREKKERDRLAMQHGAKPPMPSSQSSSSKPIVPHGHHRAPIDPKFKQHSRPPVVPYPTSRAEPRDILREAAKVSPFGIASKEYKERDHKDHNVRSDKEVQKRDYLLKPNVTETNNLNNYPDVRVGYSGDRLRVESTNRPQRPPSEPNKLPYKHDSSRRHEEPKAYLKSEIDNIKKHLSSVHEKNSAYLIKPSNSTSQKVKSPFSTDTSKSVPKSSSSHHSVKSHQQNGTGNSNVYGLPYAEMKMKSEPIIKEEPHVKEERIKEEHPIKEEYRPVEDKTSFEEPKIQVKEEKVDAYQPPVVKRQSLFSPEKSPSPQLQCSSLKTEIKLSIKKPVDMTTPTVPVPSALSPLESPGSDRRTRAYSSSSEPELRPVMKKIDQVEGFENLMRDSTIGINKLHKIPDIVTTKEQLNQYLADTKPLNSSVSSDSGIGSQVLINGIETNPMLISNLLKDAPPVIATIGANTSVMSTSLSQPTETVSAGKEKEKEHHHHKSKKKNKEKHKHKDKDRNREEKEKKKKHKDKDREKHKHKDKHEVPPQPIITEPIKIKIQKDKIQPIQPLPPAETLKIRIPKDKIKTDGIGMPSYPAVPTGGLKLKIPKEVINNCTIANECISGSGSSSSSSRKRDRDRSSPGETPPSKMSKSAYRDSKQNGRHSYNKVAQLGDGETSMNRLAESKYTKGSTS